MAAAGPLHALWRWRERAAADAVGRGAELERLSALVEAGAALVTITGPAGVGKTTLAARYTGSLRAAARGEGSRLVVCELASASDGSALHRALGQGLGVAVEGSDAEQDLDALARAVAAGPTLLVLDNYEQLLPSGAGSVRRLLGEAPELQVVVTSRERLGLSLERVLDLGPLGTPRVGEDPRGSESYALLLRRVLAEKPGYAPRDDEMEELAELLRELDGLPLAIELAAARALVLSPAELRSRLGQRFTLLRLGSEGSSAEKDLRASLDASYELLEPWERAALAQMSVFRGSPAMAVLEAVVDLSTHPEAPEVLDVVQALCRKSLVRVVEPATRPGELRFTMLHTIRAYAGERLGELGGGPEAEARHAEAFAEAASRAARAGAAGLGALVVDLADLHAAADRLGRRARGSLRDLERALSLAIDMAPATRFCSSYPEQLARLDALLAAEGADQIDPALAARARLLRGSFAMRLGRVGQALDGARAAEALAARAGALAVAGLGRALGAACLSRLGRIPEALAEAQDALAAGERSASAEVVALALEELGVVSWYLGRHEEARASLEAALEAHRLRGDPLGQVSALISLSLVRVDLRELEGARRAAEEGLALHEAIGLPLGSMAAPLLFCLARVEHAAGRLERAILGYREVQDAVAAAAEETFRIYAPAFVALARFEQGALAEASERLRAALVAIEGHGEVPFRAFLRTALGAIEALRGACDRARQLVSQGLAELAPLRGLALEGAGRLCQAIAEVAEADRASSRASEAARRDAAARLAELGPGEGRPAPFELGLAARWLGHLLSEEPRPSRAGPGARLVIGAAGRWLELDGAPRVSCSRRPVMRRMLLALAVAHEEAPGKPVSAQDLVASTWPGERMMAESARLRLHVMVSRLRDVGLGHLLETTEEGYRLAPSLTLVLRDVSDV